MSRTGSLKSNKLASAQLPNEQITLSERTKSESIFAVTMVDLNKAEWIVAFERALEPLVETATTRHIRLPALTNAEYRALGDQGKIEADAREIFDQHLPKLNADPAELLDLLSRHPAIRSNIGGADKDAATFVEMPSKGFRMTLGDIARHLTRSAVKRGCRDAVALLERFLTLSVEGRVPGYEIAVFHGLTMSGEFEIAPGLEIVPYERAAERGLVMNEAPGPTNDMPDYSGMDALVLAREMKWGPCLVPPTTSKDIFTNPAPAFRWLPGCGSGIVFDLLSIVTSHRVQVLSLLCCAPEFVDVNPNFGPGTSIGFTRDDHWAKKDLTSEHACHLQGLLHAWTQFNAEKRDTLELAVNRLASSIQRNRGRFWVQDRILDTAIALEVMYDLAAPELSYKLATRAGHLLANDSEARIAIFDRVVSFYKDRSSIAHGRKGQKNKKSNRKKRETNLKETADSGFDLARNTLQKLLHRGDFPDWKTLIMSR